MQMDFQELHELSCRENKEIFAEIKNNELINLKYGDHSSCNIENMPDISCHTHPDNSKPSVQDYCTLLYFCLRQNKILQHFVITNKKIYALKIPDNIIKKIKKIFASGKFSKLDLVVDEFKIQVQEIIKNIENLKYNLKSP